MPAFLRGTTAGAIALAVVAPASAHSLEVEAEEFAFEPNRVVVEAGERVEITFENTGRLSHNLKIPAFDVKTTTIQAGNTATVTFTPNESGTYEMLCTVPGHSQAGMTGTVVVVQE
ncbi:cupredoxin domain-containing protein [Fodinicurvata halophila]|uniref:Cupredoxin domain-containing protein n=1 Tax=Fodinicurvata halophila TaxID=1419723 RepID=A0ABV8UK31_9PROT